MAFNGTGTFLRLYNWVTDKTNSVPITASRVDAEMDGMATGLSSCITKDGQTTITANIPFNSFKATGLGVGTARTDAISVGQVQDNQFLYLGTTSGSADAYTLAPSPTITAYATTQQFTVKISATNLTATPYLQISAIANPTTTAVIKKLSATKTEIAVEASDLLVNGIYKFQRNSANDAWIVLNPEKPFYNFTNGTKATSTSQGIVYLPNPVSFTNNTTDANNDMDFTQGVISYDDGSGQSISSLSLIKQLDANFVEGTNAGGLDTSTKANSTWYQIFAITKNTTGVVDFLYSTSRTSPTIPSGWTRRAWLGAIRTNSSGNIDQNYSARRTAFGQVVSFQTGEYSSGAGIIPNDDTIPQITEGSKFMELLINPLNSSSKIEISGQAFLYNSTGGSWRAISALFKGSDVNSIATAEGVNNAGGFVVVMPFFATVNSGTTSSITFQFRAGTESSSTTYFNGSGARRYGGSFSSFLTIKEYL